MCWEFGFINTTNQKVWKTEPKLSLCLKRMDLESCKFLKPEGRDIDEVLHVLSIREVTHVPVSEVLLMIIFVLPKF